MNNNCIYIIFNINIFMICFNDIIYNLSGNIPFSLSIAAISMLMGALRLARDSNCLALRVEDMGVGLIFLGTILPALVSNREGKAVLTTISGNFCAIAGAYLSSRFYNINIKSYVKILLIFSSIHSVYAVCQFLPGVELEPNLGFHVETDEGVPIDIGRRGAGLFNNPNSYGTFMAMCICMSLTSNLGMRWMPLVVLCSIGLLLSLSRESLIGLTAGLSPILIKRPAKLTLFIILIFMTYILLSNLFPDLLFERYDPSAYSKDDSLLARFELWEDAIALIERRPMFGYGVEMLLGAVDQAYLNWLVQGGILCASFWFMGLAILAFALRQIRHLMVILAVVGFAANPFSGSTLLLLLSVCGITAGSALPNHVQTKVPCRDRVP